MKVMAFGLCSVLLLPISGCFSVKLPAPLQFLTFTQQPFLADSPNFTATPWPQLSQVNQSVLTSTSPWTAYFSTQDSPVVWAHGVRGVGRGQTGFQNSDTAPYVQALNDAPLRAKNILLPIGGLEAGRGQAQVSLFMGQMQQDRGLSWKKAVYKQAIALTKVAGGSTRIAWQVGNEINSKRMSETLSDWAQGTQNTPSANADWVIPYYVEYYLAPTVEALRKASQDSFGSDRRIPIVLGSIANAYNPNSQRWLNTLLKYRVKGTYAPSLAHQPVHTLANIIAIHYLLTSADQNWQQSLDELWHRWVGEGRVTGLWFTEELGKQRGMRGQGAATALKVTARALHWWGLRGIKPEAGRLSFWGWKLGKIPGTSAHDSMQTLYQWLGSSPLQEVKAGLSFATDTPFTPLESYVFQADNTNKRIAFIFPQTDDPSGLRSNKGQEPQKDFKTSGRIARKAVLPKIVSMQSQGWHGPVDTTMQIFSSEGSHSVKPSAVLKGNSYELSFPQRFDLANQAVALILLEHRP